MWHPSLHDAWSKFLAGHLREALKLTRAVHATAKAQGDPAVLADAEAILGFIAQDSLDFTTAETHYTRALAAFTEMRGATHPDTLHLRAERLSVWLEERRPHDLLRNEAEALRALVPPEPVDPDRRWLGGCVVVALVDLETSRGDVAEAGMRAVHAVAAASTLDVRATVVLHLATVLQARHAYAEAASLFAQAITLRSEAFGADAPRTLGARCAAAGSKILTGEVAAGVAEIQTVMGVARKLGIERSPRMAVSWLLLASGLLLLSRIDAATEAVEFASSIEDKYRGTLRVPTLEVLCAIALAQAERGNHAKVALLLERVVSTRLLEPEGDGLHDVERYLSALTQTGRHRVGTQWSLKQLATHKTRLSPQITAALEWAVAQGHMLDGKFPSSVPPLERAVAAARLAYGNEGELTKLYEEFLVRIRAGERPQRRAFA